MKWYLKVLKQYVDFKGRARRTEYWMFILINLIISWSIQGISFFAELPGLLMLGTFYSLAVALPNIAVSIRRMHDVGKSGWFILIPIYNIILLATDSENGANDWGDNPKGIGNMDAIDQIGTE